MEKSELIKEKKPLNEIPYTDAEARYHGEILIRLYKAKIARDIKHPEFNNDTFIDHYNTNEKLANTFIENKKDSSDLELATGTIEQKLNAVLSEINRLNLSPEVLAYDKEDNMLVGLGKAMSDLVFKTSKNDNDDENKLMRQQELLKQGTVFIQETWNKEYKKYKKIIEGKIGKIKGVNWEERLEKCFEGPRRKILYLPGVYLGSMREFDIQKQPFIFTHKISPYEEIKSRYGMKDSDGKYVWERFEFVPTQRVELMAQAAIDGSSNNGLANNAWSLVHVDMNEVEEIFYMDKPNNEFQIYLNGVAMLPVGFPLSAVCPGGEYNIEKQVYKVINPFFPYGRSFVSSNGLEEQSKLLDEMLRLLVIKVRKSIAPPYANMSKRVISSRVLMPGRITMGIDPDALKPIGQEGQGMTTNEYAMLKELRDNIDRNTISPQMAGQMGNKNATAYEVSVAASQAQKVISLTIFACISLEMKIAYLRLFNILENYFNPVDTQLDEVKNVIKNVYRSASRETNIDDMGMGIRKIIPTEELPSPEQIREEELYEGVPMDMQGKRMTRKKAGMPPVEKIYLNPEQIKNAKILWYIDIDTKPKETSNMSKIMFREELADIAALVNLGAKPNVEDLQNRHSVIWGRKRGKAFQEISKNNPISVGDVGRANQSGVTTVNPMMGNTVPENV